MDFILLTLKVFLIIIFMVFAGSTAIGFLIRFLIYKQPSIPDFMKDDVEKSGLVLSNAKLTFFRVISVSGVLALIFGFYFFFGIIPMLALIILMATRIPDLIKKSKKLTKAEIMFLGIISWIPYILIIYTYYK